MLIFSRSIPNVVQWIAHSDCEPVAQESFPEQAVQFLLIALWLFRCFSVRLLPHEGMMVIANQLDLPSPTP